MIKSNTTVLFQGDSITDCGRIKEVSKPNNALAMRGHQACPE